MVNPAGLLPIGLSETSRRTPLAIALNTTESVQSGQDGSRDDGLNAGIIRAATFYHQGGIEATEPILLRTSLFCKYPVAWYTSPQGYPSSNHDVARNAISCYTGEIVFHPDRERMLTTPIHTAPIFCNGTGIRFVIRGAEGSNLWLKLEKRRQALRLQLCAEQCVE